MEEHELEKKTAKLIYNKELYDFYNGIVIFPPRIKTNIFHIASPPIDVDNMKKVFNKGNGIDPLAYVGATKFSLPPDMLYKMLFTFRKADPTDVNLLFFLADFTLKERAKVKSDLRKTFILGN